MKKFKGTRQQLISHMFDKELNVVKEDLLPVDFVTEKNTIVTMDRFSLFNLALNWLHRNNTRYEQV